MTLLVFEPSQGGHQAVYARHLVEGWRRRGSPGAFVLAAPEPVIGELATPLAEAGASAEPIHPGEITPPQRGLANALGRGRLAPLRRVVAAHRPDHVLLMTFEHLVGPLARRATVLGRPTLGALAFHTGADLPRTARTVARDGMIRAALRHPDLATLYTVDPTAPPRIRALGTRAAVVAVPDPIPDPLPTPPASDARAAWGVHDGRRLAVLLGTLDGRKGAAVLLDALRHLSDDAGRQLAVVMAGRVTEPMEEAVTRGVARVRSETAVQVIHRPGFVSDADLAALTAAADVVLLPYPGQVGSSGFLMAAAAAGTPVLTQRTGLMGWLARTHGLGQTTDTSSAQAVAASLARAVDDPGVDFQPSLARAFAALHTPAAFADALLDPIFGPAR